MKNVTPLGRQDTSLVQAGVSAVAPDGVVFIAAGTYTEQVTISQSLALDGAGATATTIQAPVNFFASSDEVAIASGAFVRMSGLTVAGGANTGVGVADEGGTLTTAEIDVSGFGTSVAVQDHAAAKIADSTISSNKFGIIVGSSASDTSTLAAHNNNLSGAGVGVWNVQTSGSVDATLNWWGSVTGPTTSANPGGTGSTSAGNVEFNPWLGDANLDPFDYLVFSTTASDNDVVTPIDGDTELDVTSGAISLGPSRAATRSALPATVGTSRSRVRAPTITNSWWPTRRSSMPAAMASTTRRSISSARA